jgi:hypothetical protein
MKALTLWEPWASLIAIGAKPYEFRGWRAPRQFIGRRIAIHAGARPLRLAEVDDLLTKLEDQNEVVCLKREIAVPFLLRVRAGLMAKKRRDDLFVNDEQPFSLPLSAIVCTAVLGEPKRGELCAREFGCESGGNDSDRGDHFNWGWPMSDVRPIVPAIPVRGAQGFWDWNAAEAA